MCYCGGVGGTTRSLTVPSRRRAGPRQSGNDKKDPADRGRTALSAAVILTAALLARSEAATAGHPLPLHDGFYLDADVPCGEAYTAAMLQIMGDRFESGNNLCTIKSVSHEGRSFTVAHECQETSTGAKSAGTLNMVIPDSHTVVFGPEDDPMKYRYYHISSLPASFKNRRRRCWTPPFQ